MDMPRKTTWLPAERNSKKTPETVLQVKVTLYDVSPRVWRRVLVPTDYTFFDLHIALQDAMGWDDSHLHSFSFVPKGGKKEIVIQYPSPMHDDFGMPSLDERGEKIAEYFEKGIKHYTYTYDFGDNWEHDLVFEKILSTKPGAKYPQCVAGANVCPPDDCGGVGGYDNLRKALRNPRHPDHKDMLDWLDIKSPEELDSSAFNPAKVHFLDPKKRFAQYRRGFGF